MTVNGVVYTYQFDNNPNEAEGFELYAIDDKEHKNSIYGLSCNGIIEVIGVGLCTWDYY